MKKSLALILLIIFLNSCTTQPLITTQCSIDLSYIDKDTIDANKSSCWCRKYEFSKDHLGAIGNSWKEPDLKTCHLMIGFTLKEYPHVVEFWNDVRLEIISQKEKNNRYNR
jgi:hypothetical protein